jgi:hypothetical protein
MARRLLPVRITTEHGDSTRVNVPCPVDYPCFHDDACVEADYGQLTRPSATLHIFEGDELVLNRAYTYAPAVYPDTPLNASMKTGSVAKSITATAVLR